VWVHALLAVYWLVLMHLHFPNRGGSGFHLPGNLVGALVLCAVVLLGLWRPARGPLAGSRTLSGLLAGGALLLLPWLWSTTPYREVAQLRLLGLGLGLAAYLALLQVPLDRARRRQWLVWLLAAGVLEALLGLAQYAGYWPGGQSGGTVPRPFGVFQQWNVMASFMAITLSLSLVLAGRSGDVSRAERSLQALAQGLTPLLLVVIVSRVGLLAAVLLTPLQLVWLWRVSPARARWALARIVFGAVLGGGLLAGNGEPRSLEQASTLSYRVTVARTALDMLAEKPLLGWGYGHFQGDFIRTYHARHPQATQGFDLSHPHNELLLWGVEGGALALAGCALMLWGLGRRVWRDARGGFMRLGRCAWLPLLPLLLHMMVEYPLYLSAAHGVALLVLLRVADVRRPGRPSRHGTVALRGGVCGLVGLCALYLMNGLYSARVVLAVERGGLRDVAALKALPRPTPWEDRRAYDLALARLLRYPETRSPAALEQYLRWTGTALQVAPSVPVYLNLATIARLQGHPDEAEAWLKTARGLFPDDPRLPESRPRPRAIH
jgi:O-antigen polymerase